MFKRAMILFILLSVSATAFAAAENHLQIMPISTGAHQASTVSSTAPLKMPYAQESINAAASGKGNCPDILHCTGGTAP